MGRLYKDIGMRGTGKSTRLLKKALTEGCDIAVFNRHAIRTFVDIAALDFGYSPSANADEAYVKGVLIAPVESYVTGKHKNRKRPVLVDEISGCMANLLNNNLAGYTESIEELEGSKWPIK
jgi:hypothetical protein